MIIASFFILQMLVLPAAFILNERIQKWNEDTSTTAGNP
jgi:hypothetical protein